MRSVNAYEEAAKRHLKELMENRTVVVLEKKREHSKAKVIYTQLFDDSGYHKGFNIKQTSDNVLIVNETVETIYDSYDEYLNMGFRETFYGCLKDYKKKDA